MREFTLMPSNVAYAKAAVAAAHAIALDPSLADAHSALAFSDFYWRRDVAARREFTRAIALEPGSASAHHWYATFLMTLGDFAEARDEIEKATRLDPESTAILADKALILFYGGDLGKSVTLLKQIETDQPLFASAHLYLSVIDLLQADDKGYLREMKLQAGALHDASTAALADEGGRGFASAGHTGMLRALLVRRLALYAQGRCTAYDLAQNYALLGDRDRALNYLSASLSRQEPEIAGMKTNAFLASLRNLPEFRRLLAAAGLGARA